MDRPLVNIARTPLSTSQAPQCPSEQSLYAESALWRAKSKQAGKTTNVQIPGRVTGDPPMDGGAQTQMCQLAYGRSS
jgi:hypothetical protein